VLDRGPWSPTKMEIWGENTQFAAMPSIANDADGRREGRKVGEKKMTPLAKSCERYWVKL